MIPALPAMLMVALAADPEGVAADGPVRDAAKGVDVFQVASPYTGGRNRVEVLLPDKVEAGLVYPVLYVLPVGGDFGGKYGDGLQEVRKADAHNRHGLIAVSMAFDTVPWYGANATDLRIRHEDYLLKAILPLIEGRYPASRQAADRLLIGFSKSGFGAVNLLLRNPEVFGFACSWDAPLSFTAKDFGQVGTRPHFGTAEQMARYIPADLATQRAPELARQPARLVILGKSLWGKPTEKFHRHLDSLGIPHRYDDTLTGEHSWSSGWVAKAVELLLALRQPAAPAK